MATSYHTLKRGPEIGKVQVFQCHIFGHSWIVGLPWEHRDLEGKGEEILENEITLFRTKIVCKSIYIGKSQFLLSRITISCPQFTVSCSPLNYCICCPKSLHQLLKIILMINLLSKNHCFCYPKSLYLLP